MSSFRALCLVAALCGAVSSEWVNPPEYNDVEACMKAAPFCTCSDMQKTQNTENVTCSAACNVAECKYHNNICQCTRPTNPETTGLHPNVNGWETGNGTDCKAAYNVTDVVDCQFTCGNLPWPGSNVTNITTLGWIQTVAGDWIQTNDLKNGGGCQWNVPGGPGTNSFGQYICARHCEMSELVAMVPRANHTWDSNVTWTCPENAVINNGSLVNINTVCSYTCDRAGEGWVPAYEFAQNTDPNVCGAYDQATGADTTDGSWSNALTPDSVYCLAPCNASDLDATFAYYSDRKWKTSNVTLLSQLNCDPAQMVKHNETCESTAAFKPDPKDEATITNMTAVCMFNPATKKSEFQIVGYSTDECSAPLNLTVDIDGNTVTYESWAVDPADPLQQTFDMTCYAPWAVVGPNGGCAKATCGNQSTTPHTANMTTVYTLEYMVTQPSVEDKPKCFVSCDAKHVEIKTKDTEGKWSWGTIPNIDPVSGCTQAVNDTYSNMLVTHGTQCAVHCPYGGANTNHGPFCNNGMWVDYGVGTGGSAGDRFIFNDGVYPTCEVEPTPPVPQAAPTPSPEPQMECNYEKLKALLAPVGENNATAQPMEALNRNGYIDVTSCVILDNWNFTDPVPLTCKAGFVHNDSTITAFTCGADKQWDLTKVPLCVDPPATCDTQPAGVTGCDEKAKDGEYCQSMTCVVPNTYVEYAKGKNTDGDDVFLIPQCKDGTWENPPTCTSLCSNCTEDASCSGMCSSACAAPACGLSCEQPQIKVTLKPAKLRAFVEYDEGNPPGPDAWVGLYKAGETDLNKFVAAVPFSGASNVKKVFKNGLEAGQNVDFDVDAIDPALYDYNSDLVVSVITDYDTAGAHAAKSTGVCQTIAPVPCPPVPEPEDAGVKSFWKTLAILFMVGFFLALAGFIVILRKMTAERASYKELA